MYNHIGSDSDMESDFLGKLIKDNLIISVFVIILMVFLATVPSEAGHGMAWRSVAWHGES